jgi:hypothetical protein
MDANDGSDLWYVIDGEDRLVEASSGYFDFAAENKLAGADATIGQPLWNFVAGDSVREVQRALLRRIRRSGTSVALPFRCDGPEVRREMILRIEPVGQDDRLLVSSRPLEEARRRRQAILDPDEPRGKRTVAMCSWCGRVSVDSGWVDIERAVEGMGLAKGTRMPAIRQDLCDRCVLVLAAT